MNNEDPFLDGKIALVTGAGKGIGREFTAYLAGCGATVYALSRSQPDLSTLKEETHGLRGEIFTRTVDVRDYPAQVQIAAEIDGLHGRLDILIVNAGIDLENETIEASSVENWQATIDTNLVGSYKTVRSMVGLIKRSTAGKIILMGSGLGHRGIPLKSAYSVSKAATWMLTRILAQELIEFGITVNEIVPGPVNTEIGRDIQRTKGVVAQTFSQEWNKEPKHVTPILEFLLRQDSQGPTGQTFSLARRDIY